LEQKRTEVGQNAGTEEENSGEEIKSTPQTGTLPAAVAKVA
jgi:hypothetical protein